MRHLYRLPALTSCLLAASLSGAVAQTTSAPASSWYVAAGAAYHRYAQPETVHTNGTTSPYQLQPAQMLLGHRFANGRSLEAGFMRSQRAAAASSNRVYSDTNRDYYYYSTEGAQTVAVSVLFRVPLLRPAAESRWRLDSRVGLTYLMTRFTEKYYYVIAANPDPTPPTLEKQRRLGDLPITTGLAASYRLGPHLELTADASAHVSWILGIARLFGTSGSPVGGGVGGGLRYNL